MALTIGIDIGTTSTIGILIDTEGSTLALAERPTELFSERPGWAEEDPEQWWATPAPWSATSWRVRAERAARLRRSG